MTVKAETRDKKTLNKWIKKIVIIFAVYIVLLVASYACAGEIGGIGFILAALLITVAGIPLIAAAAVKAANAYKYTWLTDEFELYAKDGSLYCGEKKLQVNLNKKSDVLYAHDLGYKGNPQRASIYLAIEGDDKAALLGYMEDNGVAIDPDPVIEGRGKYAAVTAAANGLSKYRRK